MRQRQRRQGRRESGNAPRRLVLGAAARLPGFLLLPLAVLLADAKSHGTAAQGRSNPASQPLAAEHGNSLPASSEARLAEQKLRLLESYLTAAGRGRLAHNGNAEVDGLVNAAQGQLEAARQALAEGNTALAGALSDSALRSLAQASATAGQPPQQQSDVEWRTRLATLRRQIEGYLVAVKALLHEPGMQALHSRALRNIDAMLAQSAKHEAARAYAEANELLADAYAEILQTVSALHQGKTLVARLEFAGPEEELVYEKRRYESYALLISLALEEVAEPQRAAIAAATGRYLAMGEALRAQAEAEARKGDYVSSIRTMEQATEQLVNALRASGVEGLY